MDFILDFYTEWANTPEVLRTPGQETMFILLTGLLMIALFIIGFVVCWLVSKLKRLNNRLRDLTREWEIDNNGEDNNDGLR